MGIVDWKSGYIIVSMILNRVRRKYLWKWIESDVSRFMILVVPSLKLPQTREVSSLMSIIAKSGNTSGNWASFSKYHFLC